MMKEFVSIQYLRGVAAILVVIYHVGVPLKRMGAVDHWSNGLSAGVDIFFVISGFVMWMTTRAREVTPVAFWKKRIVRIVPLYWLVTSVMLMVMLVAPHAMSTSVFDIRHVVASYAFIPWLNPGKPAMEPLVFPGWTLNYEMFFYLIFGLFLLARPAARLWGTVAVLAALVASRLIFAPPVLSIAGFYTGDIMIEFAFGMLLGELVFVRGEDGIASRRTGWLLVAAGLATMLAPAIEGGAPRVLRYGIPALAIVAGALAVEGRGGLRDLRLPHLLGNASYSIYLTQLISMAAFAMAWRRLHLDALPGAAPLFAVGDVAFAVAVGWACHVLAEKPLVRAFRGTTRRRMPDAGVPA